MIVYRPAELEEAEIIYQEGCKCFDVSRYPYSLWSEDAVRKLIAKPNISWVAEVDARIVGFVGAHAHYQGFSAEHGFIEWCFVLSEYRRKGICSALVKKVEEYYSQLGKKYVVINTTKDNKAVQNFVSKEGYKLYAEDVFYRKNIQGVNVSERSSGPKPSPTLQLSESFVLELLYAAVIAMLLINFDLTKLSLASGLVFAGLLITIVRWCCLHHSLNTKADFYLPSRRAPISFLGFWSSVIPVVLMFFAAQYQDDLILVCFLLILLIAFDLLWELYAFIQAKKESNEKILRTVKRWFRMDSVCIVVLFLIMEGMRRFASWSPILPGSFYQFAFLMLTLSMSLWDYIDDYRKRIGLYA